MTNRNVIGRYLEMSMKQVCDGIDYHIVGQKPLTYAFGVPIYDPQDFLDWTIESNDLIEKKMQELGRALREGVGLNE